MKGGKGKKKPETVKEDFAPPREPLEKHKRTPEQELRELKEAYSLRASEYFPSAIREKLTKIIELFDRDQKDFVSFSELKVVSVLSQEILVATNNIYQDEELLKGVFELMVGQSKHNGLNHHEVFTILAKKQKDNDKKRDLMDAFEAVNEDAPLPETEDQKSTIKSDRFYDLLLYHGYRYTDEQADAVLKEADPKNKGQFEYEGFTDNILKTDKKKKKKSKKKK